MKIIGLTGAPGCGKSTVLQIFSGLGWKTIDVDDLCRKIHGPGHESFHEGLAKRWGHEVLNADGSTNRQAVAQIVFKDHAELEWLEKQIQPEAEAEADRFIAGQEPDACVMIEIPLLFEKHWERKVQAVAAIWTTPEQQMQRLLDRGWTVEHAKARMALQLSADKKLELSDYGIINTGSKDELEKECMELDKRLRNLR